MPAILLSFRAIFVLAILLLASFASHGQTVISCGKVHVTTRPSLLDDPYFTQDPMATVREVLGKNAKIKSKALLEAAQTGLKDAGVNFEIRKVLLGSNQIIISTQGEHVLNKMAARIFEKDKTQLVYDPDVAKKNTDAMFSPELKKIFVSHNVGLLGKPDFTLFHEIKHWSITNQTRTGIEQIFDSYYQKFPWSFSAIEFNSPYNRFISFQERSTWIYENKLSLKSYIRQSQNSSEIGMRLYFELSERIGQSLMISRDVHQIAQHLKEQIENNKVTVRLNRTTFRTSHEQVSLIIFNRGITQIHLPLSAKSKAETAEGRKQLALKKLSEIIETTAKDIASLDQAWAISESLMHVTKPEDIFKQTQKLEELLAN